MCILSYLPPNVPADIDGLLNGGISNPDGHGWAIVVPDERRILVGKSLKLVDALDEFADMRDKYPSGPALFHSRWATHGSVTTDNVHPFAVGGDERTVVAHNGILPSAAHPDHGDDRSDTRLFADEILSTRFRRLDKQRAFSALTGWIGTGNKLVILTVNPRYRRNAYIVNPTAGNWDKATGIWHSNYDYLSSPAWWSRYGHSTVPTLGNAADRAAAAAGLDEYDDMYDRQCDVCGYGWINAVGYCTDCHSCIDCMEDRDDCQCYVRSSGGYGDDDIAGAAAAVLDALDDR